MPKAWANWVWASVSTLPKVMSGCLSDASSNTGANCRHGPHQEAQKSTSTVPSPATTSLKLSVVSSTVAMSCSTPPDPRLFRLPAQCGGQSRSDEVVRPEGAGVGVVDEDVGGADVEEQAQQLGVDAELAQRVQLHRDVDHGQAVALREPGLGPRAPRRVSRQP